MIQSMNLPLADEFAEPFGGWDGLRNELHARGIDGVEGIWTGMNEPPDDFPKDLMTGYEHYRETILRIWTDIPDGVTETFVHPCVESDEIKQFIGMWRNRVWEFDLLNDPETHRYLADHGVQMISFRDLVRMKQS